MNRVSNEWVLKECGLKGNPICQCDISVLRWFGDVERMSVDRVSKRIYEGDRRAGVRSCLVGTVRVIRVLQLVKSASTMINLSLTAALGIFLLEVILVIIVIVTKCEYYYNRRNSDDDAIQVSPEVGVYPDRRPPIMSSVFYVGSRSIAEIV
uniref:Uncharacterized protein n=1 Tax=Timema bartmani TaxID=61472 RepID=A0A7R9FBU5_9NEOP|nr:unnamed protein product [Timema bartmani]